MDKNRKNEIRTAAETSREALERIWESLEDHENLWNSFEDFASAWLHTADEQIVNRRDGACIAVGSWCPFTRCWVTSNWEKDSVGYYWRIRKHATLQEYMTFIEALRETHR